MSAMKRWRGHQALDVLTVVCGVLAVVMLALPASTAVTPDALRIAQPKEAAARVSNRAAATADSLARAIVRTNAFSASRKEPLSRFVAPGSEPAPTVSATVSTTLSAFEPGGSVFAPSDIETGPQLFGIVSIGGTARALLQLRSPAEPPRLLGAGESFGGVRVVRITGDRVVISSSSGTRTLRLSRVVPDSSENVP
jgi:hypothetical protein